mgnify:CR=1 FL=1
MKTLKDITKKDTVNNVTKKDGTLKTRVIEALKSYQTVPNNGVIHYSFYTGSGRYTRKVSYYYELTQLLKLAGYKWTEGNDAPRGGAQGDFIKVSKAAVNFLKSLTL